MFQLVVGFGATPRNFTPNRPRLWRGRLGVALEITYFSENPQLNTTEPNFKNTNGG